MSKAVEVSTEGPVSSWTKISVGFYVAAPFAALIGGLFAAVQWSWIAWYDVVAAFVLFQLPSLGITVGFHRMLTHRSFQTYKPVRNLWTVLGCMAAQGPPLNWVADHRVHHAHTDAEGDPHSPHRYGEGPLAVLKGALHAHVAWLFTAEQSSWKQNAKDVLEDPWLRGISSSFLLWVALSVIVIPFVVGLAAAGTWQAGLQTLVWAGLVRLFFQQHITWSVNSVCHIFGSRPFGENRLTGKSTNNWLIGILANGEGWHHNHHQRPRSAKHGLLKGQFDLSWLVIRTMQRLRLAWSVDLPNKETIQRWLDEASEQEQSPTATSTV